MRADRSGSSSAHHSPSARWRTLRPRLPVRAVAVIIPILLFISVLPCIADESASRIALFSVTRTLGPVEAEYLSNGIRSADQSGISLVVVELDTTSGYPASVNKVRDTMAGSPVPVVLYFSGGKSSIGPSLRPLLSAAAASPDARSVPALLRELDGVRVTAGGGPVTLKTAGVQVSYRRMSEMLSLLSALLRPDIAYIFFILGLIGLFIEITTPGFGVPGTVGSLSLLASIAIFASLPVTVNVAGLAAIIGGVALFVLEMKLPSHGLLTAGGIGALVAGSLLLMPRGQPIRISALTIVVTTGVLAALLLFVVAKGIGVHRQKALVGRDSLLGRTGLALSAFGPDDGSDDSPPAAGVVRLGGEEWTAVSMGETVRPGDEVIVVEAEGIHLVVVKRG